MRFLRQRKGFCYMGILESVGNTPTVSERRCIYSCINICAVCAHLLSNMTQHESCNSSMATYHWRGAWITSAREERRA